MSKDNPRDSARPGSAVVRRMCTVLAVVLTCGSIAWSIDLFRPFGLLFYTEQYLGGMMAIALPLAYLHVPAGKGRAREGPVPWYDAAAAAIGFAAAVYTTIRFPDLVERMAERPLDAMAVGIVIILLITEGVRRTVGTVLTLVVVLFLGFALLGHLVPGVLAGREVSLGQLVLYIAWDPTAILGIGLKIVTTIVIAFVFFGNVLFKSGGSAFFTDISMVLMGRYRGGPAKISIFASSLFGSISGSSVSNVVTTGVITIPLMKRGGYKAHHAGAIEAVASTGGQLMPPIMGAAAFVMAEFLQISYAEVVLAAIIPSVLFYVALFVQADLEAARSHIDRIPEDQIPVAVPILKAGWFFPIPFTVLIGALFWLNYSPEHSALAATAVILVAGVAFGYKGRRLTFRDIFDAVRETGITVISLVMIGGGVGIVIGVLNISGLGFGLTLVLVEFAGGSLLTLLILGAGVCILLGMGMPTLGVYLLLATLVAPSLIEMGIDPIAAHMFILYYGMMSFITPPVCIAAFAAATLSGANPMRTGFAAARFGWLAFVIPFMFVGSTTLLMKGTPVAIVTDLVTALIGTWMVSIGLMGYSAKPLGPTMRIAYGAAGLLLVAPVDAFTGADIGNLAGVLLAIGLGSWEVLSRRARLAG